MVWEVREQVGGVAKPDGAVLALKSSESADEGSLHTTLLEARILKQLAGALGADTKAAAGVPEYIMHDVRASSHAGAAMNQKVKVRIVMSKIEGQTLDKWLFGLGVNEMKTISPTTLLYGPHPSGRFATCDLDGASKSVSALLAKMAPVFEALSKIAYHRDVAAHNFLVREAWPNSEKLGKLACSDCLPQDLEFTMIDFGLAVRAETWRTEWQTHDIAGDPRYWTPAALMALAYGNKHLTQHPDASFRRQYEERIDHFALGLLALEVLFALWQPPEWTKSAADSVVRGVDVKREPHAEEYEEAQSIVDWEKHRRKGENGDRDVNGHTITRDPPPSSVSATQMVDSAFDHAADAATTMALMMRTRTAWHAYWIESLLLYQQIHKEGCRVVGERLNSSHVIDKFVDLLRALSLTLEAAADHVPVLRVVCDLLSRRGSLDWPEVAQLTAGRPIGPKAPMADSAGEDCGRRKAACVASLSRRSHVGRENGEGALPKDSASHNGTLESGQQSPSTAPRFRLHAIHV